MFGIQPIHLLIIVIVALIIFAPMRFRGIGRELVKAWPGGFFEEGLKEIF